MSQTREALPVHDEMGRATRALEAGSIALAGMLLLALVARFARASEAHAWWLPCALVAGALAADLVSGFVHWFADTWGRETLPVLGRRFLRPFRVHHVNPADFLRRDFVDCNGDVAMLVCPILFAALVLPIGPAAAFLAALGAVALPTNQVHQWAHMPRPPRAVRWLQRRGVLLSREAHARHHTRPHTIRYCIATGWCNGLVDRLALFARAERAITRLTGLEPRADA